jgi:hypothetical protein
MAEKESIEKGQPVKVGARKFPIVGAIVVIVVLAVVLFAGSSFIDLGNSGVADGTEDISGAVPDTAGGDIPIETGRSDLDAGVLSKAKYLKEVFTVDRGRYGLFEKAAEYRGETLEETKEFFYNCCGIESEEDIFAQLPLLPADFSQVAYDLQVGRLFQIGFLGPEYYKQPEFYFRGDESGIVNRATAFRAWQEPQLNYWGDNGLSTYPSQQFDVLSKSSRNSFTATVFATNAWNIQNYVGINFVPNADAEEYFDITISEEKTGQPYFLLGPTFPVFDKDWATKVVIEGTVKPTTPSGVYVIGINPVEPPKELNEKWGREYSGLYAPYGFIRPSGNYIDLVITVEE